MTAGRKPRIVIADDFEALRRGLRSILGDAICGEAENGQQAIQRVIELRPDIVILDWTMPVMGGKEAACAIRSLSPTTKIIVFSMHDGDAIRNEVLQTGADAYLHKTSSSDLILKTVWGLTSTISVDSTVQATGESGDAVS